MQIDYGNLSNKVEMSISNGYVNDVQNSPNKSQVKNETLDMLTSLKEGDTFSGVIVEAKDKSVLVSIDGSDSYIMAKLEGTQEFSENQKVIFRVMDNQDGKITIKPFTKEIISDELAKKSLQSQGIPVNDQNITIVKELISNNLKLSKENIKAILRANQSIPNAKLEDLVKMLKYNLSLTEENFRVYNNYKENNQVISKDVDTLINNMKELFTSNRDEFVKMLLDITNLDEPLHFDENQNVKDLLNNGNELYSKLDIVGENLEIFNKINNSELESNLRELVNDNGNDNRLHDSFANNSKELEINSSEDLLGKTNNINENTTNVAKDIKEELLNLNNKINEKTQNTASGLSDLTKNTQTIENDIEKSIKDLNGNDVEKIISNTSNISNDNISEMLKNNVQKGDLTTESSSIIDRDIDIQLDKLLSSEELDTLISAIKREFGDNFDSDKLDLENLLKFQFKDEKANDVVMKLVTGTLKRTLLATPNDLSEDKVNEYFNKLTQKLNMISDFANKFLEGPTQLTKNVATIKENITFMNEMNATMQFVQIPININGKEQQAELYVYKNKKNINNDKEEKTAFIRLDMENLGKVDIFVKLFGTNVNMKFFVTNDEAKNILEDNIAGLLKNLDTLGYTSKSEFIKSEKEWSFEEDFVKKNEPFIMLKKTGFDVKA